VAQHVANHLAPTGRDDVAGVFLQRVTESIVDGNEEPGVGACLHQRAARRDRDRVRIRAPLEAIQCAGRACDDQSFFPTLTRPLPQVERVPVLPDSAI
jgi:hypothetical protein